MGNTNNRLIYDIGMHDGSDTAYYLHKGFNVVAIDANIDLINKAKERFRKHLESKQLILLNIAIADKEGMLTFNISRNDIWSSLNENVANREGLILKQVQVEAKKLSTVFREHGTPAYCKIDIEGNDAIALQTISKEQDVPLYMSVESESIGEGVVITNEEALYTLSLLHSLGYEQFKLVDQSTFEALHPQKQFYFEQPAPDMSLTARGIRYIKRKLHLNRAKDNIYNLSQQQQFKFKRGSSGPWGEDVPGEWYNYETAKNMLLMHRKDYMDIPGAIGFGFWCDWHAKK